jgi:isoquinoline 1-oxidoreductase beta subunit
VVNPDQVESQIQGGLVFGLSSALYNEITLEKGRVQQRNFNDYRMLRMNEMPRIDVEIVASDKAPGGIGETGTAISMPALANAVSAATGVRRRSLPLAAPQIGA